MSFSKRIGDDVVKPTCSQRHWRHLVTAQRLTLSGGIFLACGLWLVALGLYFAFFRPALLPEDPRYIGVSLEELRSAAPGLEGWLNHVFNVMGGFMVATGALTTLVACRLVGSRERGTFAALWVAGAAGVAMMSATNFLLYSDFRWWLLLPALLWLAGLICYLRGNTGASQLS
jgi:hypothetical protein